MKLGKERRAFGRGFGRAGLKGPSNHGRKD